MSTHQLLEVKYRTHGTHDILPTNKEAFVVTCSHTCIKNVEMNTGSIQPGENVSKTFAKGSVMKEPIDKYDQAQRRQQSVYVEQRASVTHFIVAVCLI